MRHRRTIIMAATIGLLAATIAATPSSAAVPKPKIVAFNYPTAITRPNQVAEITGSIRGANTCTITITPSVIVGDGTFDCTGGDLATTIEFPQNTGRKPVVYTLTLHLQGDLSRLDKKYKIKVWKDAAGGITSAVAAGATHTCAVMLDGSIKCWGSNYRMELGNSWPYSNAPEYAPNAITPVSGTATQITAGNEHTCALMSDQTVKCWGDNTFGQTGTAAGPNAVPPSQVTSLTGVLQITAGQDHTCALMSDHTVKCWGSNMYGQLGAGTTGFPSASSPLPVRSGEGTLGNVVAISAAYYSTCALLVDTTVRCWGEMDEGELGNGSFSSGTGCHCVPSAASVSNLSDVTQIDGGGHHNCAVKTNQTVWCWGRINVHETGPLWASVPVQIAGIPDAVEVAAGGSHTCVRTTGGTIECWGLSDHGQLGVGGVIGSGSCNGLACSDVPLSVSMPIGVGTPTQLTALGDHTCVLTTHKRVFCWGAGDRGQLGNGQGTDSATPVEVIGP